MVSAASMLNNYAMGIGILLDLFRVPYFRGNVLGEKEK